MENTIFLEDLKRDNKKIIDSILWSQLKAGNQAAFSQLFEKYYSLLVNYGKTLMITDTDTVRDCVQDVFVDIWTYRTKLDEVISVKAYLLVSVRKRIARVYGRNYVFNQARDINLVDFLFDFSIEDQLIADEATALKVEQLNRFINSLSSRQKEALYLRYHQKLSVEQISEVLNMNYQSTKNLLHRAILQLRKNFLNYVLVLMIDSLLLLSFF